MTSVRWTVALPTDHVDRADEFITADAIAEMARAMETAGIDAGHVTEHPFPPASWVETGGHHALDPLVALSFAGAATRGLRLHTNVLVLGYRNPFLAAKGVSSLDRITAGRVILGVAVGYLEPEFAVLGADYHRRGKLLDEALDAMKLAWTGEPVNTESVHGHVMLPRPAATPHPPIWIGGNSRVAITRAVARGQGWVPFPASGATAKAVRTAEMRDHSDLERAIGELHGEMERTGRTEPVDVCCTPFSHPHWEERFDPPVLVEEAAKLAALGVTWLSIRLPAPSRAGFLENVERFGREVIRGGS